MNSLRFLLTFDMITFSGTTVIVIYLLSVKGMVIPNPYALQALKHC